MKDTHERGSAGTNANLIGTARAVQWDLSPRALRSRMSGETVEVIEAARKAAHGTFEALRLAGESATKTIDEIPVGQRCFIGWCSVAMQHGLQMIEACAAGNSTSAWEMWRAMLEAVGRAVWAWDRTEQELWDADEAERQSGKSSAGGSRLLYGNEPDWFRKLGRSRSTHQKAIRQLRKLMATYPAGENRDVTGRPTSRNIEQMLHSMAHSGAVAVQLIASGRGWVGSEEGDASAVDVARKTADTIACLAEHLLLPELAEGRGGIHAREKMAAVIFAWKPFSMSG